MKIWNFFRNRPLGVVSFMPPYVSCVVFSVDDSSEKECSSVVAKLTEYCKPMEHGGCI